MAKLMKSSAMEGGNTGLRAAMMLAGDAHTAFNEAIRFQWVDATLAEAALVSLYRFIVYDITDVIVPRSLLSLNLQLILNIPQAAPPTL
jgi:hypothetical protein